MGMTSEVSPAASYRVEMGRELAFGACWDHLPPVKETANHVDGKAYDNKNFSTQAVHRICPQCLGGVQGCTTA